jgi:hypothetical protein
MDDQSKQWEDQEKGEMEVERSVERHTILFLSAVGTHFRVPSANHCPFKQQYCGVSARNDPDDALR